MDELKKRYLEFLNNYQIPTNFNDQMKKIRFCFTDEEIKKINLFVFSNDFSDDDSIKDKNEVVRNFLAQLFVLSEYSVMDESGFYAKEDVEAMKKASDKMLVNLFYVSVIKYFATKSDLKSIHACVENAKKDGIKEGQINTILDKFGYDDLLKKEQETKQDDILDSLIQTAQSLKGKDIDKDQIAQMFRQLADNLGKTSVDGDVKDSKSNVDLSAHEEKKDSKITANNQSNNEEQNVEKSGFFDADANILNNIKKLIEIPTLPRKYSKMRSYIGELVAGGISEDALCDYVEKYISDNISGKYATDSFKVMKVNAVLCACKNEQFSERIYSLIVLKCSAKSLSNAQKNHDEQYLKDNYKKFKEHIYECLRCGCDKKAAEKVIEDYGLKGNVDKIIAESPEITALMKQREEASKQQEFQKSAKQRGTYLVDDEIELTGGPVMVEEVDINDLNVMAASIKNKSDETTKKSDINSDFDNDKKEYNPYDDEVHEEDDIVEKSVATQEERAKFGVRLKKALNILWNGRTSEVTDEKGDKVL